MTQEFHISVTPIGDRRYLVRTERVPAGAPLAEEQVTWDVDGWLTQSRYLMYAPIQGVPQSDSNSADNLSNSTRNLVELGQELYTALFQGTLRDSWVIAQGIAQNRREALRLRLGLQGSELPCLSWEMMHGTDVPVERLRQSGSVTSVPRPLATGTRIIFSRYRPNIRLAEEILVNRSDPEQPLRILMIVSESLDQEQQLSWYVGQIQHELEANLQTEASEAEIELTVLSQPGREELTRTLAEKQFQILHYANHSGSGTEGDGLYLMNKRTGLTEILRGDDFTRLIANSGVRLVIFNSCRGAYAAAHFADTQTVSLAESSVNYGIPAVLSIEEKIPDDVILTLTTLFYQNLKSGFPIDLSLSRARQGLISAYGSQQTYWAVPVLYMHPEFDGYLQIPQQMVAPDSSQDDSRSISILIAALKDKDRNAKQNAVKALGKIGDNQTIAALLEALGDENSEVRLSVVEVLEQIGTEAVIPGLLQSLQDSNSAVREKASSVLGSIGSEAAIPGLLNALKDKNSKVRRNVAEALGKIAPSNLKLINVAINQLHDDQNYEVAITLLDHSLQFHPDNFELHIRRGNLYSELGVYEKAIASYDSVLRLKPNLYQVWSERGDALSNLDQCEQAISSYDQALIFKPDFLLAWEKRGDLLIGLGRLEEAISSYDRVITIDSTDPRVWFYRGNALVGLGRYEEAISSYDKSIEQKPPKRNRGAVLTRRGNYRLQQAIRTFSAQEAYSKELTIEDLSTRIRLSVDTISKVLERKRGVDRQTLKIFFQAFGISLSKPDYTQPNLDFSYAQVWCYRGNALACLNRSKDAISDYNKALELDPRFSEVWNYRGCLLKDMGRLTDAIADFNRAIELKPNYHLTIVNRGETYLLLERYEEALVDFNRAIELKPDFVAAIANRGEVYRFLLRYEEALHDFNQAIEIEHQEAWLFTSRGQIFFEIERYEEALQDLNRAIDLSPEYIEAIARRGEVYRVLERYEEALADFTHTIELNPDSEWAIALRGQTLFEIGRYQEARQNYEQALAICREKGDRGNEVAYLRNIGIACQDLNNYQEAIEHFQASLAVSREIGDSQNEAESLEALASNYFSLEDYSRATECYQRSLEIYRHINDHHGQISSLIALGDIDQDLNNFQQSIDFYEQALSISEEIDEKLKALTQKKIVQTLLYLEDVEQATETAHLISDRQIRFEAIVKVTEAVKRLWSNRAEELLSPFLNDPDERIRQIINQLLISKDIIEVFISCSQRDKELRDGLLAHLQPLEYQGIIIRRDCQILPGTQWDEEIRKRLNSADIILLLISADFLAADYSNEVEIPEALQRHKAGEAIVMPVILRPCDWEHTPLAEIQAYPEKAKPIKSWQNIDEAYADVAGRVYLAITEIKKRRSHNQSLQLLNNAPQYLSYSVFFRSSKNSVPLGSELEITIFLSSSSDNQADAYLLEISPNDSLGNELNILLNPPGFRVEGDSVASLPLDPTVNTQQTSQTASFRLTALRPGTNTITAEIYRGDTFETTLQTTVQVTAPEESELPNVGIKAQPRPVSQPDLVLQVQTQWDETASVSTFHYQLRSFRNTPLLSRGVSYTSQPLPRSWLEQVQDLLAAYLQTLSSSLPEDGYSQLISLGQYLFQSLFPIELQTDLRTLNRYQSITLLLLTDQEAQFPWSLLHNGQEFLGERFIIGQWLWDLNNHRPHEFPVGAINLAHYANVEQPETWATLLEPPGAPPPFILPGGMLEADLSSIEAMRGLHLLRFGQSLEEVDRRDAPVPLDASGMIQDLEQKVRPVKLNLRRNRPLVTLGYLRQDQPELTSLEKTWAPTFLRAGCSAFVGSLWAVSPETEAAFISTFYHALWKGDSLGGAFQTARKVARATLPESIDWLAYVLFGDPMARPYRPIQGQGYAVVEPIGQEIDDPVSPGTTVRFRVSLRRTPPVWHEERVIEVAENLSFNDLQAHIVTFGLQITPATSVSLSVTPSGNYIGWFNLTVPPDLSGESTLVQIYFADGMQTIHTLTFPLKIAQVAEG